MEAGCDEAGSDCVLAIEVLNGSGVAASWAVVPFHPPKDMVVAAASVTATVTAVSAAADDSAAAVTLTANATALYVVLTTQAPGRFEDNAFLLEAGRPRTLAFVPWGPLDAELLRKTLRVEHLAENL